jgi:chemotaxis protein CheD
MNIQQVTMGASKIGQAPDVLEAPSVGSCVAVCLYDPQTKTGTMAHIMLPKKPKYAQTLAIEHQAHDPDETGKYADDAIAYMVKKLERRSIPISRLEAKIAGGSEMFKILRNNPNGIGPQNIQAITKRLSELSIPIVSDDTGGSVGRTIRFYLQSGDMEVRKRL